MIREREINNLYFDWMYDQIGDRYSSIVTYNQLLMYLHTVDFQWDIPMDSNRAFDGISLRDKFAFENNIPTEEVQLYLDYPCSMLEMMIALAIRCEYHIMEDDKYGDRTSQWFWGMIVSLGLGNMKDSKFDKKFVDETLDIFFKHEYKPDGEGGLFTVPNCAHDMRETEIWYQMMYYLNFALDNNYI